MNHVCKLIFVPTSFKYSLNSTLPNKLPHGKKIQHDFTIPFRLITLARLVLSSYLKMKKCPFASELRILGLNPTRIALPDLQLCTKLTAQRFYHFGPLPIKISGYASVTHGDYIWYMFIYLSRYLDQEATKQTFRLKKGPALVTRNLLHNFELVCSQGCRQKIFQGGRVHRKSPKISKKIPKNSTI